MSKEIERRFFNFDRLEIERRLKEFNAVKKGIFFFKIIQYERNAPIKRIRLRDEGFRVTFTIKEQTNDYDLENEVVVSDFKEMRIMLKKIGFDNFQLITGLLNTKRILINDYNDANPYPRAIAINIKRNHDNLKDFL